MKAAAASKPGKVVIADFPEPQAGPQDLIVETLACGICSTDVKLVQKGTEELQYALGHEMSARVLQAPREGPWTIGQHVVVAPYLPCGRCYYCRHGQEALCTRLYEIFPLPGGLSERILVPAELARRGLFPVPTGMSDARAALAEPLGCVLMGLDASTLKKDDSLLVIGDGPMGQLAAAAGKVLGAGLVLMAGMTDHRLACAKAYFADEVIDIRKEDLHQVVADRTEKRGADVVLVAVSSGEALASGIANVRPGGRVNSFAGVPASTQIDLDVRRLHYQQYILTGSSGTTPRFMAGALDLLQCSSVDFEKVITATYPFAQTEAAVSYVEKQSGLKAMVTFAPNEEAN